jgi:TfoX/Sxy family transcriptional regulator of competence genes
MDNYGPYKTKKQKTNALKAIWSKTTRLWTSGEVLKSQDVLAIEKILVRATARLK